MTTRRIQFAALFLAGLSAFPAQAEEFTFKSSVHQTQFVELYTSEGCSSCPRADAYLSSMQRKSGLWKNIVPVAFHVDYWNDRGWEDPYATSRNTARQHSYVRSRQMRDAYTPNFIVDGREWRGFSTGDTLPLRTSNRPGRLTAESDGVSQLIVEFDPEGYAGERVYVWAAVLGFGLVNDVDAGENLGRRLKHDFVAVAMDSDLVEKKDGKFRTRLDLQAPMDLGAERLGMAVWVTPDNDPGPIQATGGYLP